MRFLKGLRARLRDMLFRSAAEDAMDEEIRFHLEMETEKNLRAGMDPLEARRRARVAFGGVERHRETLREGRRLPLLESLWGDVRFGLRSLARDKGLSAVAAITIGLGVGAAATVFSVGNALLLRPPQIPGGERVHTIQERRSGAVSTGMEGMLIPFTRYQRYEEATGDVFVALAAHRTDDFSLRLPDRTVHVAGSLTSGNFFEALGLSPRPGRAYRSTGAAEVVISHRLWTERFGGDPGVVGSAIAVDGRVVTVVGVAPPGFRGVTLQSDDIWVPAGVRDTTLAAWDVRVVPIGRLRPGVTRERAAAAVEAVALRTPPEHPATVIHGAALDNGAMTPPAARTAVTGFIGILLGMAVVVLLIASANIAGVMLARSVSRRRELAVRRALGAGRARLVRHLLAESVLIFVLGGGLGLALAWLGAAWLASVPVPPQLSAVIDVAPDGRVMAFGVVLTALTALVFGLVPALRGSAASPATELRAGGAGAIGGDGRLRGLFVGGQVGLAVLLLLTATLFARSLRSGLETDLGFDPAGVVVAELDLGPPLEYGRDSGAALYGELLQRVRSLPEVRAATLAQYPPMAFGTSGFMAGRPAAPDVERVHVSYTSVAPGYFDAMGMEMAAGRGFTDHDDEGAERVVVVNESLARRLWPGSSPLADRIDGFTSEHLKVVGVVRDAHHSLVSDEVEPYVYLPLGQAYRHAMSVLARAPGREAETLRRIREEVRGLDADVAVRRPTTLPRMVEANLMPQRLAAQLVGAFGLVGLALAALGIYGVLAYHVARRSRELAVRRVLGARGREVVGDVVARGGLLAVAGCALGCLAGALIAPLVGRFLLGVEPLDPFTFAVVPSVLLAAALLASLVPALRAAAIEPAAALREE